MAWLLTPFVYLALIGLIFSLIAHVCGLFGLPQPLGHATWLLHIGIFVVIIPVVVVGPKSSPNADMSGCPAWFRRLTNFFAAYALFNFATFFLMLILLGLMYPESGQLPSETKSALIFRGFSGHWMWFYSVAAAALESTIVMSKQTQPPPSSLTPDP